jgi:hypothetical protein
MLKAWKIKIHIQDILFWPKANNFNDFYLDCSFQFLDAQFLN